MTVLKPKQKNKPNKLKSAAADLTLESLKKEIDTLKTAYSELSLLLQPKYSFITVTAAESSNEVRIIKIKDILFITTDETKLKIVTIDGTEFFNFDTLANMDKKFAAHPFFVRTHKSYFANLQNVDSVKMSDVGRILVYSSGKKKIEVPVSYTYIKPIKDFFDF